MTLLSKLYIFESFPNLLSFASFKVQELFCFGFASLLLLDDLELTLPDEYSYLGSSYELALLFQF